MSEPSDPTTVRIVRVLPATPEEAFEAWQDPESIRIWMCPGAILESAAELDVRVGGRYRIAMRDAEAEYVSEGEYLEVDPPNRLAFTWTSPGTQGATTRVTVTFRPLGTDETEMTLIHEQFPDADAASQHERGWGQIAEKLAKHLAG